MWCDAIPLLQATIAIAIYINSKECLIIALFIKALKFFSYSAWLAKNCLVIARHVWVFCLWIATDSINLILYFEKQDNHLTTMSLIQFLMWKGKIQIKILNIFRHPQDALKKKQSPFFGILPSFQMIHITAYIVQCTMYNLHVYNLYYVYIRHVCIYIV